MLGKKDESLVNSHIGAGLDSSLSNSMDQCNFIHVTFAHRDDYVRRLSVRLFVLYSYLNGSYSVPRTLVLCTIDKREQCILELWNAVY